MLVILQYLGLTDEQMKDKRMVIEATQHYMDGYINKQWNTETFIGESNNQVGCLMTSSSP